jgi:hypothetical protein
MRIVLLPVLLGRDTTSRPKSTLAGWPAAGKKKGRVCGLSLAAPGPPGVSEMIVDFADYAKSPAERLR